MIKVLPAFGLCALVFLAKSVSAQEGKKATIQVGGSIVAAVDILRKSRTEFVEGGLALTRPDKDQANLLCFVDKHRTSAALFYSKSTKKITSISVIFIPQQQHTRMQEIRTEAKSFTLEEDGSYSLQLLRAKAPTGQPKREDENPRSNYAPNPKSSIATKGDMTPFEGDWEVCSASYQLSGLINYKFRGARLTIESWSSLEKNVNAPKTKNVDEWTIKIDTSLSPPRLVMTSVESTGKPPITIKDAIEFKDGELWLCKDDGQDITSKSFVPGAGGWVTGLRRSEKRAR